jgi:hypothetical protein
MATKRTTARAPKTEEAREEVRPDDSAGSEDVPAPAKRFVTVSTPIDSRNVKRTIQPIGPTTCTECGFDVIRVSGIPPWEELDSESRIEAKAALKRHTDKVHQGVNKERAVVTDDDLEGQWLAKPRPI